MEQPISIHTRVLALQLYTLRGPYLGHHPPPRNDISLTLLPRIAFIGSNRLQQSIQMLVSGIIQFLKGIKATVQICRELRRIVVPQG